MKNLPKIDRSRKKGKWTDQELESEKQRLRDEILKKETELNRLKRQLDFFEDAICVFTI